MLNFNDIKINNYSQQIMLLSLIASELSKPANNKVYYNMIQFNEYVAEIYSNNCILYHPKNYNIKEDEGIFLEFNFENMTINARKHVSKYPYYLSGFQFFEYRNIRTVLDEYSDFTVKFNYKEDFAYIEFGEYEYVDWLNELPIDDKTPNLIIKTCSLSKTDHDKDIYNNVLRKLKNIGKKLYITNSPIIFRRKTK